MCVQGDARVQGRPQFHSNSSVHEPGQARGRARVCTSVTSPAHHVPSEPGSPYSKAQRGGLDGSGHSARLFQGTTDLQMQRLLYREAASGLPGQHFPPQPRTQARNKTSRFHRTSHRKSLWGRPRPPFPHDWLGAAANSRLTSAPGACEPELPADAGFPTPGRGAPPTLPAPTRTSAQSQSPEDDLQGRVVPWRALLPGVSPGSGLPRPGVSSSHGGTSLAD
ncbi:uncharacterized protein LOC116744187 isoform X2 [Phocoena sinus]|uniref:uncharacterized protein LOC116744187 isoform X2 n=1 Tax=Phocoena sinus TaxID=42100 RepID=UPI0013C47837|nr:uncharacterized protein LOC116744187 isoform X2 [Phocoena sinus]